MPVAAGVEINWRGADCDAIKALGARHGWCIPYDVLETLAKVDPSLYEALIKDMGKMEVVQSCWEYQCGDGEIRCIKPGLYICAEYCRVCRAIIKRAWEVLALP